MSAEGPDGPRPAAQVSYFDSSTTGQLYARLASGKTIPVESGRARAYPSLPSAAPQTAALYWLAAQALGPGERVLDVGCGAGAGLCALAPGFQQVVACEPCEPAAEFARAYCPEARVLCGEIAQVPSDIPFDAIVVVDLLGQVADPFLLLCSLHRNLGPGGRVVVCEPAAFPSQCLVAPARRAFSMRALQSLLGSAGFRVQHTLLESTAFHGVLAAAEPGDPHLELEQAARALQSNDSSAAIASYDRARRSASLPVRMEAELAIARLAEAQGDGDQACSALFRARALDPSDPRPLSSLAQLCLLTGQIEEAIFLSEKAMSLDPTDAGSSYAAAALAERLFPAGASAHWRRACNLMPDNLEVARAWARASLASNDVESAIYAFERVRQYDQHDALGVHVELTRALARAGRVADAALEFRAVCALAPEDPALVDLGRLLSSATSLVSTPFA